MPTVKVRELGCIAAALLVLTANSVQAGRRADRSGHCPSFRSSPDHTRDGVQTMTINRRDLLALSAVGLSGIAVGGERARNAGSTSAEILKLWPTLPPGATGKLPEEHFEERVQGGVSNRVLVGVARPQLEWVRPRKPNGAALLVIPGGAYIEEWIDKEGFEIAERFAAAGITSFILRYRLTARRLGSAVGRTGAGCSASSPCPARSCRGTEDRSQAHLRHGFLCRRSSSRQRVDSGFGGVSVGRRCGCWLSTARSLRVTLPADRHERGCTQ